MPEPSPPSRRALLRLVGLAGVGGAVTVLAGCSAEQRAALLDVDPREVRLDDVDGPVPPRPRPSEREQRRRAVLAGSATALAAYASAGDLTPPLRGRTGSAASREEAVSVHEEHVVLLGGPAAPPDEVVQDPRLPSLPLDDAGPVAAPGSRPAAVLGAGATSAVRAALRERAAEDAQVDLAVLHARIAAARAAQAAALRGDGAGPLRWPTTSVGAEVVEALQGLLAQEHRARWSYGVVVAWSTDRLDDAGTARSDHTERVEALQRLLRLLGAEPVRALTTYPTGEGGQPVNGPATAAALALRLEDAVTAASAVLLSAVLTAPGGSAGWVSSAVAALAESERSRWSWGGPVAVLPGG